MSGTLYFLQFCNDPHDKPGDDAVKLAVLETHGATEDLHNVNQ